MAKHKSNPLRCEDAGRYADLCECSNPDGLLIVFSPSLAANLARAERDKGTALTPDEIIRIRDNAPAIAVTAEQASALEEKRGYADVDPAQPCESWLRMQSE